MSFLSWLPLAGGGNREHHAKNCASRLAVELDNAAVIANDLCDQCKTQAGSVRLGRHKWVK
jgi:hypothetical protein